MTKIPEEIVEELASNNIETVCHADGLDVVVLFVYEDIEIGVRIAGGSRMTQKELVLELDSQLVDLAIQVEEEDDDRAECVRYISDVVNLWALADTVRKYNSGQKRQA
jgi:hypothetical protein